MWFALSLAPLSLASSSRGAEAVSAMVSALERAAELRPSHAPTLVNLGLVWSEIGSPTSAMEAFGRALAVDPRNAAAYQHIGSLLENGFGERALAAEALRTSISLDATRPEAFNALGSTLHASGELDEAEAALRRAVKLSPRNVPMLRNLATTLRSVGQFDKAVALLREAARLSAEERRGDITLVELTFFNELAEPAAATSSAAGRIMAQLPASLHPHSTPAPWLRRLCQVHVARAASAEECEWVIQEAEAGAAARGGWDCDGHHAAHRTNDIEVAEHAALCDWVSAKLHQSIWPALEAQFGVDAIDLWLEDAFVVKYEAGGQPGLGPHVDDSELSFNLLLSDPSGFEGGGTRFCDVPLGEAEGETDEAESARRSGDREGSRGVTVRPGRGEVITHYGRLPHEGVPITRGTRYIVAGFVRCRPLAEQWRLLRPPAAELRNPAGA